jgi:hypothetical protein
LLNWIIKEIKNIKVRCNNKTLKLKGERPTIKVTIPPLDEQIRAENRIDEAMRIFFEEME